MYPNIQVVSAALCATHRNMRVNWTAGCVLKRCKQTGDSTTTIKNWNRKLPLLRSWTLLKITISELPSHTWKRTALNFTEWHSACVQGICWANMPRMYGGVLWCQGPDGGLAPVESQQHLEICKAYLHLHQGKDVENNFKGKVNFLMDMMAERTKSK